MASDSRPSFPGNRSGWVRLRAVVEQIDCTIRRGRSLFRRSLEIHVVSFAALVEANRKTATGCAARDDGSLGAQEFSFEKATGGFAISERAITTGGMHPGIRRIGVEVNTSLWSQEPGLRNSERHRPAGEL